MLQARADGQAATLLPDGRVLVTGLPPVSAELYDSRTGSWSAAAPMLEARGYHTATLLGDGRSSSPGTLRGLDSAEIYDPVADAWSATRSMAVGRAGHVASPLGDGRVLVAGGQDGTEAVIASTEIYDPGTGSWTTAAALSQARLLPTVTQLLDGRVLVTGGQDGAGAALASAELFDPRAGTWTSTGEMHEPRSYGTATRLNDGTVLVAGGGDRLVSAELFDPDPGTWSRAGLMREGRSQHVAVLLSDGKVLVGGGDGGSRAEPAELYDPSTGSWKDTGAMTEWRASPSATLLQDGRVMVAGGFTQGDGSTAEIYDPGHLAVPATPPPWADRCELGCHGPIAAGTFASTGFWPGMELTFADDAWFDTADYPGELQLEGSGAVLRFLRDPGAPSKADELLADVPRTPQGLTEWMVGNKDMVVSEPETVTLGGGITATTFTLEIADTNENVDPGCPRGVRSCLSLLWIGEGHTYAIGYGDAVRFYPFTVGSGADAHTVVATLDGPSIELVEQLTPEVTSILESMQVP
jgi:N-acetylneuraminic acid mutarotase